MKMIYGYARVSTTDQILDRQINTLEEYGVDFIYKDKSTGANMDREGYKDLLDMVAANYKKGINVEVVFAEFDRLGRDYDKIKDAIAEFDKLNVEITFLDLPMIKTDDPLTNKLLRDQIISLMSFIAQKEREKIRKRQSEGIANAKAKGKHLGRPCAEYPENWMSVYHQWKTGTIKGVEAMQMMGLKKSTFYKLVKKYETDIN